MKNKTYRRFAACAALLVLLSAFPAAGLNAPAVQNATGYVYDDSPEGGYEGDYVVVLNSHFPDGLRLSTGLIGALIERDIPAFEFSDNRAPQPEIYESKSAGQADPFAESAGLERKTPWDAGACQNFTLAGTEGISPGGDVIAFKVLHVGQRCRIWTPLNPDYAPLDRIDAAYAQIVADEFDARFGRLVQRFGNFLDLLGDGLVNMLFYNIQTPQISGYTSYNDLYERVTIGGVEYESNACPIIHIDTYGVAGIVRVDARGEQTQDVSRCFPVVAHEFQHLVYESKMHDDPVYRAYRESEAGKAAFVSTIDNHVWMTEFLSAAAGILCYPRMFLDDYVPFWYVWGAGFQDVRNHFSRHPEVLANGDTLAQRGRDIFRWKGQKADYSLAAFLAQFACVRGGEGVFSKAVSLWNQQRVELGLKKPVEAVARALGYSDFSRFHRDFVLSFLFNDMESEGGRYRLSENHGEGARGQAGEALSMLRPPLMNGNEAKIEPGGYTVFKPVGRVYFPPVTAMDGLLYVGVSIPRPEETPTAEGPTP